TRRASNSSASSILPTSRSSWSVRRLKNTPSNSGNRRARKRRPRTRSTGCSIASEAGLAYLCGLVPQLHVGFVDRLQKLVELRDIFDWPDSIDCRSQQVQVPLSQQANCDDALLHVTKSPIIIWVRNPRPRLKCL